MTGEAPSCGGEAHPPLNPGSPLYFDLCLTLLLKEIDAQICCQQGYRKPLMYDVLTAGVESMKANQADRGMTESRR